MKTKTEELQIQGTPISRGIAIGTPFFFSIEEHDCPDFPISIDNIEAEIVRYRDAIAKSRQEVSRLKEQLESEGAIEGAAVLEAHLQMMQDPLLTTVVEEEIRTTRKNAESLFQASIKKVEKKFKDMKDPFFRERFKDIQDIARRVIAHLKEGCRSSLAQLPDNSIVFTHELAPSDTAEAKAFSVSAFVTEVGGATSHAAIVAKAKGMPYVSSVDVGLIQRFSHRQVIVDGRTGKVILNPSSETLNTYRRFQKQLESHFESLEKTGKLEASTYDGYSIRLCANIEMVNELDMLHAYGGDGVGLFRSEFIFLANHTFPSEEEQVSIYQRVVEKMRGLPIVIRTFDIGGDKFPEHKQLHKEVDHHPLLGCRAIRFLLKEKDIFKTQLRAILRASVYGKVSILFPMIASLSELREAKALVQQAKEELQKERKSVAPHVPIGCMIEVPSTAVITGAIAQECEFLSIGTNDLVQYALAVDRGVQGFNSWDTPTHPSIARLIKLITLQANRRGVSVSVCGEIAADPRFTPLLIGLGVNELSVAPRYLPVVKNAIRNISYLDAVALAEQALQMNTSDEIQTLLTEEYVRSVPSDFLYNC